RCNPGILALPRTAPGGVAGGLASASGAFAVRRLVLTDFRGYGAARVQLSAAPVALFGPNGAGKTNLLEALSFLAPGRGLRRAKLGEVDRHGAERPWTVAAELATGNGAVRIGTGREPTAAGGERRTVRIDGAPARSQAALA